jgi:hypothetical protein
MVHLSSFRNVKAFGRTNFISSTGCPSEHPAQRIVVGGSNNCALGPHGGILSGSGNLYAATADFGAIVSGLEHTLSGNASVILGGRSNTVTHNCAAVFGDSLTSVADNTLHVNCLNAVSTPIRPGGPPLPAGTIFRYDSSLGAPPVGSLPLYIM